MIAPRVGGIDDFFPKIWPWAVPRASSNDPEAYADILKSISRSPAKARCDADSLRNLVEARHTLDAFKQDLLAIPGYLEVDSDNEMHNEPDSEGEFYTYAAY